jgi:hypothetical protein
MIRKGWSYKEDRRLSELAGSGKNLEQIAKAMDRTPDFVRNPRRFMWYEELILKLIEALKWPAVTVIALLMFRSAVAIPGAFNRNASAMAMTERGWIFNKSANNRSPEKAGVISNPSARSSLGRPFRLHPCIGAQRTPDRAS